MTKSLDTSPGGPDRDEIDAVAAVWLSLRDRGMSPDETAEFMRWLQEDPAHAEAFAELESAWRDVGRLAVMRPHSDLPPDRDLLAPRPRPPRRHGPWLTTLAAAAAALALGIFVWQEASMTRDSAVTTVGSFQKIDLPDGSVVQLNTDSALDFEYNGRTRQVRLRRGEAHFEVAKDPARPFLVSAGGISVRAIGTAFNVRLRGTDVEVLVTEGRIGVHRAELKTRDAPVAEPRLELSAGEMTRVPQAQIAAAKVNEIAAPEVRRTLAWQERRIEFDAMPLAEVVEEFNRYNRCRLVITDRTLAAKSFTGVFRADEYQTFVRILETTFGVRAERRTDEIRLQPGR